MDGMTWWQIVCMCVGAGVLLFAGVYVMYLILANFYDFVIAPLRKRKLTMTAASYDFEGYISDQFLYLKPVFSTHNDYYQARRFVKDCLERYRRENPE